MSDLPDVAGKAHGWRKQSIENLCLRVTSGGTPLRKNPNFYENGTIHWFKTKELKDWYLEDSEEKITEEALSHSSAKLFPPKTVLMAMYGDGRTITTLGILRKGSATNQACCALIANPAACHYLFLFYALKYHRRTLVSLALGGAQRNLNGQIIKAFEIRVPPLATQQRIAAILSAYDDLIETNLRRTRILEEMAQALYREWFVKFRFPGHERVRMVESSLGEIPEGWIWRSFAQVAEFVNGFAFKPKHWHETGKPIIKIRELKSGVTSSTPRYHGDDIKAKYHVQSGDLLFSWSADLDAYIWSGGDGLLNQHLFIVIPAEGLTKNFMFLALKDRMDLFRSKSLGTTMRHIKRSALSEVEVLIPTQEMRARFERQAQPAMSLVLNLRAKDRILRETRDLLLPRLISGELDVSDLDIDIGDEAA